MGKEKCKCRRTVKRHEDEERRKDVSLYTCRTLFTRLENSLFDRRPRHNDGEHKRENGDTLCSCSIRETIIGGNRENGVSRRLQHGVQTYLIIFSHRSPIYRSEHCYNQLLQICGMRSFVQINVKISFEKEKRTYTDLFLYRNKSKIISKRK